jgi:hypothetical protein
MIPLISSMCRGPLGVCQLPRFWWKAITRKVGVMDEEYPDCSNGLDIWLIRALGLDRDETLEYLRGELPDYLQFEKWVLEQKGGTLDRFAVERYNDGIDKRVHVDPGKIVETYEDIGWGYEVTHTSAVLLNALQDWQLFHKRDLIGGESNLTAPVIPLISSIDQGPLGVCQLPRTWLKVVLKAKGLLHPEYPDCGGGLDARVLKVLELDREETVAHLRGELPDYLEFERWVEGRGKLEAGVVAEWNRSIVERVHNEQKIADIHATIGREDDGSLTSAVVLNQVEDWHLAHRALLEKR